ncbi:MAG: cysteine-rich CWC family protein, partial [Thermodesulfobacteriota bacterium]
MLKWQIRRFEIDIKQNEILSSCPKCGGLFKCGLKNSHSSCWCFDIEV